MVVNLIGSGGAEPHMRSAAVVKGRVERQLLLGRGETVRDQDQTPRALGLDGSDAARDYRQAPVPPQRTEAMPNSLAMTPPPEPPSR